MYRAFHCVVVACLAAGVFASTLVADDSKPSPIQFESTDWPWWRGPQRNGIAAANQAPPLKWSRTENVLWKSPVPGRGHGSVTVVGEQVFLATADEQADKQIVLCFDRNTGKQLWQTVVHDRGIERKGNKKASQASGTIACDGERLFVNFLNKGAAYTTALTRGGEQLWQTKITDYVVHQGYGSSPALYDSLVIVSADNKQKAGGAIAALNRATGNIVWRHDRPATPNYPSPIILKAGGRDQVFLTGCDLVSSFDPLSGKKLWEIEGATTECVTSTVTDGNIILTSGGYPKNHIAAVRADGSGEIVWENNVRVYVPSMLIHEGTIYGVADAGVAMCWDAATGKERWKGRLGGTFSSSPVIVGKHIYVTNEAGESSVFNADPEKFELVAKNQLGNEVYATPTICGSRIYMRVAEQQGDRRQEMLYCLGKQ
ncbi:MAG: PQQ-binding-like beta-propeller repeat protein [Planctomycetes bacterium]|nr:PQQ-binding-like beta-propeller repeat protein [Planctomycetota bacterium]